LTTSGHEHVLYSFKNTPDGCCPWSPVIYYKGLLYGTTVSGGANAHNGTVYAVDLQGHERVLHSFGAASDGAVPYAGLAVLKDELYGTTAGGGLGHGAVFRIDAAGNEHVAYAFKGSPDGATPVSPLLAMNGKLYGTTGGGGASNGGMVYELMGSRERGIYSFPQKGTAPSKLTDVNGELYGATWGPMTLPDSWGGTVYRLTLTGQHTTLHTFGVVQNDGCEPLGGLIYANRTLYGTTEQCGYHMAGTVYSIQP
jgi:uncharacterized repeat protein (TIGR03803 family)